MRSLRILCVEDEPALREGLAALLREEGCEVVVSTNAEDALQHLRGEHFDLLITALRLTHRTGAWLLGQARAERLVDETRVFVIAEDRDSIPLSGCRMFSKPLDLDELLRATGDLARSLAPRPGAVAVPSRVHLVLYVSQNSITSLHALRNLEQVLRDHPGGEVTYEVFTIGVDGAPPPSDRVVFTPTLVRRRPEPRAWVVGDLADARHVLALIEAPWSVAHPEGG